MRAYAKVVNEETKACIVGLGNPDAIFKKEQQGSINGETIESKEITVTIGEYYESQGMELLDVEQAESGGWYLAGYAPTKPLTELKEEAYQTLWQNYKTYQQTYVDAEDLTLAVVCANGGSQKGAAVQMWVMNLWARYYTVKDAITAAETAEALAAVDLTADAFGAPPYTIRELNEEAAAAMAAEK